MFQALYKEDFEKNKGKGFSVVVDTPEMQRVKKTQDQISNVSASLQKNTERVGSTKYLFSTECFFHKGQKINRTETDARSMLSRKA